MDLFFDNYLPSAINNPSAECVLFKAKLANALSVEIQKKMADQAKEKNK